MAKDPFHQAPGFTADENGDYGTVRGPSGGMGLGIIVGTMLFGLVLVTCCGGIVVFAVQRIGDRKAPQVAEQDPVAADVAEAGDTTTNPTPAPPQLDPTPAPNPTPTPPQTAPKPTPRQPDPTPTPPQPEPKPNPSPPTPTPTPRPGPPAFDLDATLAALNGSSNVQRHRAFNALAAAEVDDDRREEVMEEFLKWLGSPFTRGLAMSAMVKWADAQSVPLLLAEAEKAHEAGDRGAERFIVDLLAQIGDERGAPAAFAYLETQHDVGGAYAALQRLGPSAVEELVSLCLADLETNEPERQRRAVTCLRTTPVVESRKSEVARAVTPLVEESELRPPAVETLVNWGTPEIVPELLPMAQGTDDNLKQSALRLLVALKDPRGAPLIAEGLSINFFTRMDARGKLLAMGPAAESAVWAHMQHPDWRVRMDVAGILGQIGTVRSIRHLQDTVDNDESPHVKRTATAALKAIAEAKREPVTTNLPTASGDDTTEPREP